MSSPVRLTIAIATFNSGKILPRVLSSIKKQTYSKKWVTILIVDGGSTDNTLSVAKSYHCDILKNPKVVPAWAKYLAYKTVKSDFLMFLDSDEVIEDKQSIKRKMAVFQKRSKVRAVTGSGYKSPKGYIFLNQYINEFGDPFSFFVYRLSKDHRFFINSMMQRYLVTEEEADSLTFDFSKSEALPIFELVAMGSIVDLRFLKKNFPKIMRNPGLVPHFFNLIVSKGGQVSIVKNDLLIHYSADTMQKYLGKIRSRIRNNVFTAAGEGFKGREAFLRGTNRYKKYLFVPYSLSLVLPLIDALYLASTRKNLGYFIHSPLCLYTSLFILYYMVLKALGFRPMLKSYGEAKNIREKI